MATLGQREIEILEDVRKPRERRRLPLPGSSVVYDRAYAELARHKFIRKVHAHGRHVWSYSDYYVITVHGRRALQERRRRFSTAAGRLPKRDPQKMHWIHPSPDVWITGRRLTVQTENVHGELRAHHVVFRVDGRHKSREGYRVDRGGLMGWEAVDGGEGFRTAAAGKAFAAKYLREISVQKTLTPRVARDRKRSRR